MDQGLHQLLGQKSEIHVPLGVSSEEECMGTGGTQS